MANTTDARTWREAAKGGSKGNEIYRALQATLKTNVGNTVHNKIIENAMFIKTFPLELSKEINKFVSTAAFKGLRSSQIASAIKDKTAGYTQQRLELIARTESSKAMTALTEARAKDVGVKWYIWKTANDGKRVRASHALMQNVLVRWDDPPAPEELIGQKSLGHYNAGEIFNCRCYARPLIVLNNVQWPAKVYYGGTIQTMTKLQFEKITA